MKNKVLSIEKKYSSINFNHRKKDMYLGWKLIYIRPDRSIKEALDVRFYSTKTRVYCCCWLFDKGFPAASAYAGGYGYHFGSAAFQEVLDKMGIKLEESIHGVGDGAIEDAILAIGEYLYKDEDVVLQLIKYYS